MRSFTKLCDIVTSNTCRLLPMTSWCILRWPPACLQWWLTSPGRLRLAGGEWPSSLLMVWPWAGLHWWCQWQLASGESVTNQWRCLVTFSHHSGQLWGAAVAAFELLSILMLRTVACAWSLCSISVSWYFCNQCVKSPVANVGYVCSASTSHQFRKFQSHWFPVPFQSVVKNLNFPLDSCSCCSIYSDVRAPSAFGINSYLLMLGRCGWWLCDVINAE